MLKVILVAAVSIHDLEWNILLDGISPCVGPGVNMYPGSADSQQICDYAGERKLAREKIATLALSVSLIGCR